MPTLIFSTQKDNLSHYDNTQRYKEVFHFLTEVLGLSVNSAFGKYNGNPLVSLVIKGLTEKEAKDLSKQLCSKYDQKCCLLVTNLEGFLIRGCLLLDTLGVFTECNYKNTPNCTQIGDFVFTFK